jgi:hypothetical protein
MGLGGVRGKELERKEGRNKKEARHRTEGIRRKKE